ncbi:MAG: general secretion pathway protein GspB [Candidatus Omnitrophota bacterium]
MNKICFSIIITALLILLTITAVYATNSFRYDRHDRRDPFVPLVTPDGQLLITTTPEEDTSVADIFLEGIMYDTKGDSVAIINGELLRKGDSYGAVKIKEIRTDKVVIIIDGKEYVMTVFNEEVPGDKKEGGNNEK